MFLFNLIQNNRLHFSSLKLWHLLGMRGGPKSTSIVISVIQSHLMSERGKEPQPLLSYWSPEAAWLLMLLIILYRAIGIIQAKLFTNANCLKYQVKLALKLSKWNWYCLRKLLNYSKRELSCLKCLHTIKIWQMTITIVTFSKG